MKTAISLPDLVFKEAESLAQRLGLSRSELYTKALKSYLRRHNRDRILSKLNELYAEEPVLIDPVLTQMQFMTLSKEDW
jgi:metal-responsive CopG/Arc/MetJ family transcriptional regulator